MSGTRAFVVLCALYGELREVYFSLGRALDMCRVKLTVVWMELAVCWEVTAGQVVVGDGRFD
jgi:hypothetical protein